jgi:hypothetical protein
MERRMMIGIKQLAEGSDRARMANHMMVVLWAITFGFFVTAITMVIRTERWGRPLAGMIVGAALFQFLTFVQPPLVIAGLSVVLAAAVLFLPVTGLTTRPVRLSAGVRA